MQRSALCRSRRELSNEYLFAKIGVDTAENEPLEVWGENSIHYSIVSLLAGLRELEEELGICFERSRELQKCYFPEDDEGKPSCSVVKDLLDAQDGFKNCDLHSDSEAIIRACSGEEVVQPKCLDEYSDEEVGVWKIIDRERGTRKRRTFVKATGRGHRRTVRKRSKIGKSEAVAHVRKGITLREKFLGRAVLFIQVGGWVVGA